MAIPSKPIYLQDPDGNEVVIVGLKDFVKDKTLTISGAHSLISGDSKNYRGWTLSSANEARKAKGMELFYSFMGFGIAKGAL